MRKAKTILVAIGLIAASLSVHAAKVPGPLVEADWLAASRGKVVILDVRKDVKTYAGAPEFAKDKKTGKSKLAKVGGHIPGAILVDYEKIRVTRKVGSNTIDYLIPDKAAFETMVQSWGVNKDSAVVIASQGEGNADMTMATRLYWQLKYFGHDNLAILNGGTAAWIVSGQKVTGAATPPKTGNWVATAERNELLASSDDVAKAVKDRSAQLVDNRPLSQYLGSAKQSYVYEYGHIPGAKLYANELLTTSGVPSKFPPVKDLKQLAGAMGVDTGRNSITYCNSGHLASGGWFVMHELMGNNNVKLYDGSMHEWTREKHPVTAMKME